MNLLIIHAVARGKLPKIRTAKVSKDGVLAVTIKNRVFTTVDDLNSLEFTRYELK